jgi:hypothetical protein
VSSMNIQVLPAERQRQMRKTRYEIVETIDLGVWIFTPVPRWAQTVIVCDNDLEYG